jgi:hypothetical protein
LFDAAGQIGERGDELVVDKVQQASPVMPSSSAAQLRQRSASGWALVVVSGELQLFFKASNTLRNSSQVSWDSRWASPSTPLSWRMVSWMDLMMDDRLDMLRTLDI